MPLWDCLLICRNNPPFHSFILFQHSPSDTKPMPCLCAGHFPVYSYSPLCFAGTTNFLSHLIPSVHLPLPLTFQPPPQWATSVAPLLALTLLCTQTLWSLQGCSQESWPKAQASLLRERMLVCSLAVVLFLPAVGFLCIWLFDAVWWSWSGHIGGNSIQAGDCSFSSPYSLHLPCGYNCF